MSVQTLLGSWVDGKERLDSKGSSTELLSTFEEKRRSH